MGVENTFSVADNDNNDEHTFSLIEKLENLWDRWLGWRHQLSWKEYEELSDEIDDTVKELTGTKN